MLSDPWFWVAAVPAVLIAGIAKGGFSGGAAFAATPMIALAVGPVNAAAIMLPLLMVMDVLALRSWWGKWSWPDARLLILGAVPGIALGAWLFRSVDEDVLRLALGTMSVAFVAYMLAKGRGWIEVPTRERLNPVSAGGWGAVCGFTSFVTHAGGPPAAMHMLSRPLTKGQFQGTSVILFACVNLMKAPCYAALGLFGNANLGASAALAPLAAIGIGLGVWLHRRVSERLFYAIIYVFLTLIGLRLIASGLGY